MKKLDYTTTFLTSEGEIFTQQKVKIDENKKPIIIKDEKGEPVRNQFGETLYAVEEVPITIKDIIITVASIQIDPKATPMELLNIGSAGIAASKNQDLSNEQIQVIKDNIDKVPRYRQPYLYALIINEFAEALKEDKKKK